MLSICPSGADRNPSVGEGFVCTHTWGCENMTGGSTVLACQGVVQVAGVVRAPDIRVVRVVVAQPGQKPARHIVQLLLVQFALGAGVRHVLLVLKLRVVLVGLRRGAHGGPPVGRQTSNGCRASPPPACVAGASGHSTSIVGQRDTSVTSSRMIYEQVLGSVGRNDEKVKAILDEEGL